MERLTTNKAVSEMSTYELAHNCMIAKDRQAWYRGFDREISLRDLIREIAYGNNIALPVEDEEFDEELYACLQYDPADSIEGMLALLNMFAWAHADNSAKLKMYEDAEEQGLLLRPKVTLNSFVYMESEFWGIIPYKVCHIYYSIHGFCYSVCAFDGDELLDEQEIDDEDFGKAVFLTEAEAEQALADMKKG